MWNRIPACPVPSPNSLHPVESLIIKAQADFENLIEKQSRTLDDAEKEYRLRHARDPPQGFGEWFVFAKSKGSLLIDDFDMINTNLEPLRHISPQHLHESIHNMTRIEGLALRKCRFSKGMFQAQAGDRIIEDFGRLLEEVSNSVPDVEFAFKVIDEPRAVFTRSTNFNFEDSSHRSI